MNIKEMISSAKKKIEQIKKNYHFKSENERRKKEAQLTEELMICAGDLGVCRSTYERAVRRQSEEIREGMANGYPVTVQKNLLMDAAVGYMIVKEALFVIQSVATYDSIVDAYALLDMAAKTITGEKMKRPKKSKRPSREEYAFLNSFETVEAKKRIVTSSGFMDMLIATGDIEKCIEAARENGGTESVSYETSVPSELQQTENVQPVSLSAEEMKILTEMQRSAEWSKRQTSNGMGNVSTNTPSSAASAENASENKTGGNET